MGPKVAGGDLCHLLEMGAEREQRLLSGLLQS